MNSSDSNNEAERLARIAESRASDPATAALLEGYAELASELSQCPMAWLSLATPNHEVVCSAFGIAPHMIELEGSLLHGIIEAGVPLAFNFPTERLPIEDRPTVAYCAGFPLLAEDGIVMGGLFVAHNRPQTLTLFQQRSLTTLSKAASKLLELEYGLMQARSELEARASEGERLARAVGKLQDMTIAKEVREAELSERNAELQTMAETDGLTGLRNHRSLFDEMEHKFEEGGGFAFLLIDIDWFKNFNDAYGHVAGDETLRTTARLLAADAAEDLIVARYGGEEFALILPTADPKQALEFGEVLRKRIERHSWVTRPITVCVGVAIRTPEIRTIEDLVRRADAALYAAKRTGKNRVLAWSQS